VVCIVTTSRISSVTNLIREIRHWVYFTIFFIGNNFHRHTKSYFKFLTEPYIKHDASTESQYTPEENHCCQIWCHSQQPLLSDLVPFPITTTAVRSGAIPNKNHCCPIWCHSQQQKPLLSGLVPFPTTETTAVRSGTIPNNRNHCCQIWCHSQQQKPLLSDLVPFPTIKTTAVRSGAIPNKNHCCQIWCHSQ